MAKSMARRTKVTCIISLCLALAIVLFSFFSPISAIAQENQSQPTTQTTSGQVKQDVTRSGLTADQIKEQFFSGMKKLGTEVLPATYGLDQQQAKQTEAGQFVNPPTTSQTKTTEASQFVTPQIETDTKDILYPVDTPQQYGSVPATYGVTYAERPTIGTASAPTTITPVYPVYIPTSNKTTLYQPTVSPVSPPAKQSGDLGLLGSILPATTSGDTSIGALLTTTKTVIQEGISIVSTHKEIIYLLLILFVSAIFAQIGGWRVGLVGLVGILLLCAGITASTGIMIVPTYVIFVIAIFAVALVIISFTRTMGGGS